MSGLVEHFQNTRLDQMTLSTQVVANVGTSANEVVASMAEADTSCAFIMDSGSIAGIFTEHDVTHRVVRSPDQWDQPVENFMTAEPSIAAGNQSALDGLRLMTDRSFRNLPVALDAPTRFANLTHYDLIALASQFLESNHQESSEFSAEHTLRYVDFYGMPSRVPLEVQGDTSLFDTIQLMIESDRGLVSIIDGRGVVIGEFTQHDVFRRVACRVDDLNDEVVADWMTTTNIATTAPSANIADGLREMAAKRHRYLVVINETGRSIGVVTFRDIANFFLAAFQPG